MPDGRSSRREEDGAGPAVAGVRRRDRLAAIRSNSQGLACIPSPGRVDHFLPLRARCLHPLPREVRGCQLLPAASCCPPCLQGTGPAGPIPARPIGAGVRTRRGGCAVDVLGGAHDGRAAPIGWGHKRVPPAPVIKPDAARSISDDDPPALIWSKRPPMRVPRSGSWDVPMAHGAQPSGVRTA